MDQTLWIKIQEFDFDHPISEYGFTTRLAKENYWTDDFTLKAILEYKKFMYLAGTSDFMVSPSEIIDIVWHQHLIFTQSYADFCKLIGKNIQHIPSTHNKEDFEKFKQAKERTKSLYIVAFGQQPIAFWEYSGMYESLHLEKSKFKIRSFILFGVLVFSILTWPFYLLLKPVYIQIGNPDFIRSYLFGGALLLLGLEWYNRFYFRSIMEGFEPFSFIHHLEPMELVYLKTQNPSAIIHGNVNQLLEEKAIILNDKKALQPNLANNSTSKERFAIMEVLQDMGGSFYPTLLKRVISKPVFSNIPNAMDAFKKYWIKSRAFGKLFYLNFSVLSLLLLFGLTRLATGIIRSKPVTELIVLLVMLFVFILFFLWRLCKQICTDTIPKFYKTKIASVSSPVKPLDWQWNYFLMGTAIFSESFIPLVRYTDGNSSSSGSCGTSCGSSCSSGCGSSCSSCGGCGGD
ncbi:glycine-rich domain-containing protein [Flavobacterium humi]|uniref:glycine-rich domain-containing protein n=1 Tax=Flavobacterium humi TaxID=2562683 RepID=UPI00146E8D37|nr:hypothetical protein [Flavobacterium humi]